MNSKMIAFINAQVIRGDGLNCQIMKLNFTNKRDRKYCQYFIKAIKQFQDLSRQEQQFPVYLTVNSEQLKLASSIQDLHTRNVTKLCLVVIRSEAYSLLNHQMKNQVEIYRINCYKLMKALKKNQAKIIMIQLQFQQQRVTVTFQTENCQMACKIKIESEQINQKWPENPESNDQTNYQIIKLAELAQEELKDLSIDIEEEQVWLEIWEGGIYLRTLENGKYRKQNKLLLKEDNCFNCNILKGKLKRKRFIKIRGEVLLQILYDCLSKKRKTSLSIKNIYHPYDENQINMSYLIAKTENECGYIIGISKCHICEQMGMKGDESIRKPIVIQREARESSLLKRQESVDQTRRIMLNRLNEVDQDKRIAQIYYKEKKPVGKIEQGEETFIRQYHPKF